LTVAAAIPVAAHGRRREAFMRSRRAALFIGFHLVPALNALPPCRPVTAIAHLKPDMGSRALIANPVFATMVMVGITVLGCSRTSGCASSRCRT
jgi:hypothetical protein